MKICCFCRKTYSLTFVTHDRDVHTSFFQQSQSLSFSAVFHVTEIKARDEDPKTKIGCLMEELSQSVRAVGTRRPGAKPGDGVADSLRTSNTIAPQARAQGSNVTQEQQLRERRMKDDIINFFMFIFVLYMNRLSYSTLHTSTWQPLRLRRCPKSNDKESGPARFFTTKQRYVSHRPLAQRMFL